MTNPNFSGTHVRDEERDNGAVSNEPSLPRTRDVLGVQLGHFASREKEDFLATQHELRTGQVLLRQYEEDEDPKVEAAHYKKRVAKFRKENGDLALPASIAGNPVALGRELERMERSHRNTPIPDKDTEPLRYAKRVEDWRHMNALRSSLAMEGHDYENVALPDKDEQAAKRYAMFTRTADPDKRRLQCTVSTDADLMRLVYLNDIDERVKRAAEERYGQLMAGGR